MKIFILIFLLNLSLTLAQSDQIAVITNPEIGAGSNSANLIQVVEDINKRPNITGVVVLGNITANGKFDEFIWAQEILDELTAPYFVVGGEKDYLLSEGKGSEITLLWGDDKYFQHENNYSMVCINSFLSEYPSKKYFNTETLSRLREEFGYNNTARLMLFSCYPIQKAENSNKLFEMLLDKKLFTFLGKEDISLKSHSMMEGLYLNRKDGWGYLLVAAKNDSIHITKILSEDIKKKTKPEIIQTTFTKPLVTEKRRQETYISEGSKIWSTSVNQSVATSTLFAKDNIYLSFKKGLILCLSSNGKEKWQFETNEKLYKAPFLENDLLIVASDDGDIITINSNTGIPHQSIGIGERITTDIVVIDIEERGSITKAVVVGTEYGNLLCYDLYSLNPLWTQQLSGMGESIHPISDIGYSRNKIFIRDNLGTLYCFSAVNGMLIWEIDSSTGGWKANSSNLLYVSGNIKVLNNKIYLGDANGNLYCVDALLGTPQWNIKNINSNGLMRQSGEKDLILSTTKNKIIIVSAKLGKVTSEIDLLISGDNEVITDLQVIGKNIVVSFSNGWVYKIKAKQKAIKIFRGGLAPVISLTDLDGNCLVTDYDGKITLLKLSP